MKSLSKFIFVTFFLTLNLVILGFYFLKVSLVSAQSLDDTCVPKGNRLCPTSHSSQCSLDDNEFCCDSEESCQALQLITNRDQVGVGTIVDDPKPFPELKLPCDKEYEKEFHSLRPYQAAPCGDTDKALYCSNDIQFIESFNLTDKCPRNGNTSDFWCPVNHKVEPHDLFIELTGSMFPIMGNTEEVTNSQGGTEQYDDAIKVNEYVSWYLSGVNDRAEYGEPTDDQIVNYSGPVKKLLPSIIQDAQRIQSINNTSDELDYIDEETGEKRTDKLNHNQTVVCADEPVLGLFGKTKEEPCYGGNVYKLKDWNGSLGLASELSNFILNMVEKLPDSLKPYRNLILDASAGRVWDKKTPPLPWDDGTVEAIGTNVETGETTRKPIPFESNLLYQKAYNEWRGKGCVIIPIINKLICVDNPFVKNKWADLYHYIPLSNTTDKGGANYILGDGPDIQPGAGTILAGRDEGDGDARDARTKPQFKRFRNAPLFFAHTQEVRELSEILNKTYTPGEYESETLPETTEKNVCSAVKIRANKGDNLFAGDKDEMQVLDVEYTIEQVLCEVEMNDEQSCKCPNNQSTCPSSQQKCNPTYTHKCNAEVYITIHTGTKTPNAEQIFSSTVADSGSTFRKMFPKVEEGAPVSCIADIPTVTKVNYDRSQSEKPNGGSQTSKVIRYPEDGSPGKAELTFPHVGSVYEYFLKGIQTALRPKGYGTPIVSGVCEDGEKGVCKQWLFEKDKFGRSYYDVVISTAAETTCNGKQLNPFWAIGIALNENGGLMTDHPEGHSTSHFGCNISNFQSIEDKISCMANTLRNDCEDGKTDEEALEEYGYLPGYILWPITVLDPGGTYPPPLFGSGFDTDQLIANLLNADWRSAYASKAKIFCPNSPGGFPN